MGGHGLALARKGAARVGALVERADLQVQVELVRDDGLGAGAMRAEHGPVEAFARMDVDLADRQAFGAAALDERALDELDGALLRSATSREGAGVQPEREQRRP